MALSIEVLQALATPVTVAELAHRLALPPPHLQRELERLERRGYVRRLTCAPTACGWCALQASCTPLALDRWLRT